MRPTVTIALLAASLLGATESLSGQSAAAAPSAGAEPVAPDSTPPKHGGGLFGKAKKFVGNKTVQAAAKTVACTMVPGGQAIAGAMDAASSKNAEKAAAGVAGGAACMPGGMGGAGLTGAAVPGMSSGLPGAVAGKIAGAGTSAGTEAALSRARGAGTPEALGYGGSAAGLGEGELARCLGFTPEEHRQFTDPTHGAGRAPTKAEKKRQARLAHKVDAGRYQQCLLQQQAAADRAASAEAHAVEPAPLPRARVQVSADIVGELRKGKTALRRIGWVSGVAVLEEGAGAGFSDALAKLALALREVGGRYRADFYVEPPTDKATAERIGAARFAAVRDALDHAGLPDGVVVPGTVKVEKDVRLELVRIER